MMRGPPCTVQRLGRASGRMAKSKAVFLRGSETDVKSCRIMRATLADQGSGRQAKGKAKPQN